MDPSALIFAALAVAWAVYLIPKALEHHEESTRSRTVDRFSHTVRVLARREPVGRRGSALVTPGQPARRSVREFAPAAPLDDVVASSGATAVAAPVSRVRRSAASRRRRVLVAILLLTVVVAALGATGVLAWGWIAVPLVVLVAWLVACRLMVRHEHTALDADRARAPGSVKEWLATGDEQAELDAQLDDGPVTEEVEAVPAAPSSHEGAEPAAPPADQAGVWDPLPVTLPTYVSKPAATQRTVRTIDLDSTGVWSSGRNESDSQLVRDDEADKAANARAESDAAARKPRATGS